MMEFIMMAFFCAVATASSTGAREKDLKQNFIDTLAPGEVVEDYRTGMGYRLNKDGKVEEFELVA